MTDKEKACKTICGNAPHKTMCTMCKCYLAGLKAGRLQQHDLRKDQNDLLMDTMLSNFTKAKELIGELISSLSVVGECEEEECKLLNRAEKFLKENT